MTDRLKYIFENVNNWLTFAEAKNAGLIALDAAIMMGLITWDRFQRTNYFDVLLLCLVCLSLVISLISFMPFEKNTEKIDKWIVFYTKKIVSPNYLLYSYIAKYKSSEAGAEKYMQDLCTSYRISDYQVNQEDKDLVIEIIYNSKLAVRKYCLFRVSLLLLCLFIVIGGVKTLFF